MRPSDAAFRHWVAEALALIPEDFQPYLENVVIQVEPWATPELLREAGLPEDEDLYGLYLGTPLTEPGRLPGLPDRILIFREPLMEDFSNRQDLKREIAITVIHEVAHHFGIDEGRLEDLGLE